MKILYRVSLIFMIGCAFFAAGVFADSYYRSRIENNKNTQESGFRMYSQPIEEGQSAPEQSDVTGESEAAPVLGVMDKVTCDTVYMVEELDKVSGKKIEQELDLPPKYIGFSRETLEEDLKQYELAPSLKDQEKGFVSLSLLSFSPEQIVIRKIYQNSELEAFYLTAENNFVVVYKYDLETMYMKTDISLDHLPVDVQTDIINMKYVENEEALYNFLESYSS